MFTLSSARSSCVKRLATTASQLSHSGNNISQISGHNVNVTRSVTGKSLPAAQAFVEKVTSICPNDEQWKYYRKPEIDANTTVYETFYGQSCMLAPVSYDILHSKQEDYHQEEDTRSNYTQCVQTIMNERLTDAIENQQNQLGYGLKRIIIGGVNKDVRESILEDARYGNADHTVTSTIRSALYAENMDEFAESIDLERLQSKVIAFDFDFDLDCNKTGRNSLEEELLIDQIKESGYKYVMKRLDVNDLDSVVNLNHYGNYGLLYSNEFDFYVEACLNYSKLPHYGVYTVLPPSSLFGPRLKLIGCSLVHMANLSIGGVAVDQKYRRHGIASALLYQCAKDMFDNGFDMVYAHYREENEDAMKWFEQLKGWQQLDRKHFWITLGYDANPTSD